ncbi:MAG TPA: LacI family DNA-binding transcriptional regulator [Rhodothermales bacterium]|nr:LacI family DNA-binding transcriptional regulator [Rhodothermales bacterium]
MKRSTIKDVAAEAGVAISTVSLAMSGKGYVRDETKQRVKDAAKRLNYAPAKAAQRLASTQTGYIGFVLRADHFRRSEPFYTRVFLGTEFEAHHHGHYVLLTTVPSPFDAEKHTPRFLREASIDGLMIAGKVDPSFLSYLDGLSLPIVLIDFEFDDIPSVLIDNTGGAAAAVRHLLSRSHERIAFLGADMTHPSIRSRLDGYRLALAGAGFPADDRLVVASTNGEPDTETGRVLATRLLAMDPMPTAVFCANDALALTVIRTAAEAGIRIPQDLAVVGFDDVESARLASPSLTTVRVFKEQLGELASRYLAELILSRPESDNRYERSSHTIRVPTELVVRAST